MILSLLLQIILLSSKSLLLVVLGIQKKVKRLFYQDSFINQINTNFDDK